MSGAFEALSGAQAMRAQGKSAENIANYQAAVAEQEATALRSKAKFEQTRQVGMAERIKSSMTAAIAVAGGLGSPVAEDLAAEQAAELELENLLIGYEGEVGAKRAESQAILDRLQGQLTRQQAKSAARQANIGFGMQLGSLALLSGFGRGGGGGGTSAGSTITGRSAPGLTPFQTQVFGR